MDVKLKLLLLEDNPADAELIQLLLERAGLQFSAQVASDEKEFLAALRNNGFDAVLADNALPQYSSIEALRLIRSTNPNVAFILVTGTMSEEFAVNIIQQGADDYILKTNLTRLPAAISGAIDKKRAERETRKEKELSDSIINSLPGVFYLYDEAGNFIRWNTNFETVSGYDKTEIKQMKPGDFFEEMNKDHVLNWIRKVFEEGYSETEAMVVTKKGERIPYFLTGSVVHFHDRPCLIGVGLDISSSKQTERELKQLTEELRQFSAHLDKVKEEEQRRIAREIHDELGQQMTGLKMDVSALRKGINGNLKPLEIQGKLHEMDQLLDVAVSTIRRISSQLRPSILDDLGLAAALEWQSREFEKRFSISVDFESAGETGIIDPAIGIALFRMFQESLTNVARHSGARQVFCHFDVLPHALTLSVRDDGKGFDMEEARQTRSLGLLGMKERAYMINGRVQINTQKGKGTEVIITVPL